MIRKNVSFKLVKEFFFQFSLLNKHVFPLPGKVRLRPQKTTTAKDNLDNRIMPLQYMNHY
jgi:hypothetical protein